VFVHHLYLPARCLSSKPLCNAPACRHADGLGRRLHLTACPACLPQVRPFLPAAGTKKKDKKKKEEGAAEKKPDTWAILK
jgi:hypothetical protein